MDMDRKAYKAYRLSACTCKAYRLSVSAFGKPTVVVLNIIREDHTKQRETGTCLEICIRATCRRIKRKTGTIRMQVIVERARASEEVLGVCCSAEYNLRGSYKAKRDRYLFRDTM